MINPNTLQQPNESDPRKRRVGDLLAKLLIARRPSIEARIDATKGPFIEVGAAPSHPNSGRRLLDLSKVAKPLITSNIEPQRIIESYYEHRVTGKQKVVAHRNDVPSGRLWKFLGGGDKPLTIDRSGGTTKFIAPEDKLDFLADAEALPLQDATVGALYANALPPELEAEFIANEAPRVLEPGGVLILGKAKEATPEAASSRYFDTVKVRKYKSRRGTPFRDYAAVRNNEPYQQPQTEQEPTHGSSTTP
jgi:SAM-dependent methyltransferase